MNKRNQAILNEYLGQLYLTTARKEYIDLASQARNENLSYEQYLLLVLQGEKQGRKNRRINKWFKESRLPLEKNLDTFEIKRIPNKVKQQFNHLLKGEFLNHKENVLVFGNPGSGKTHLICALGYELIKQDKKVYFSTCAMLLQELLAAKRDLKLPNFIRKLNKFHAIIIDDIGYVQQNKEEMEVLFTLLAQRYEQGSVLITSNLPFSQWEKIFKDPMMTAAAIDRIVHHSVILELNISSYRINAAKQRKLNERG